VAAALALYFRGPSPHRSRPPLSGLGALESRLRRRARSSRAIGARLFSIIHRTMWRYAIAARCMLKRLDYLSHRNLSTVSTSLLQVYVGLSYELGHWLAQRLPVKKP
jgi:hypothetical protein